MLRVMYLKRQIIFAILGFAFIATFSACSSTDKRSESAEGAYAIAQEYEADGRYEEAIKRFQEVRSKFPYSKYATMAELAVADTYFKQESFAEAQTSYQLFKDLHPKHGQIDYVTFRLALSYFKQLPSTIDRDLTLADNAIISFDEVIKQYPNSSYVEEAKTYRSQAIKMLAEKEEYIADFYYRREQWDSALGRYQDLVLKFPKQGFDEKSLSRMAICAFKLGDEDKASGYLSKLEKSYPESSFIGETRKEIRK